MFVICKMGWVKYKLNSFEETTKYIILEYKRLEARKKAIFGASQWGNDSDTPKPDWRHKHWVALLVSPWGVQQA